MVSPFSTISGKGPKGKYIILVRGGGMQHLEIACQYLHWSKPEDIRLKSASKRENGSLLITGSTSWADVCALEARSKNLKISTGGVG